MAVASYRSTCGHSCLKPYLSDVHYLQRCSNAQECSRLGRNILNVKGKPHPNLKPNCSPNTNLTLTPKPKVWKLLKKEKKKWSYELKCATIIAKTKVIKVRAEPKAFGATDLKHICCAATSVPLE